MTRFISQNILRLAATAGVATAACLSLAGCTLENSASQPSSYTMGAISGKTMGGETPIKGAAVTLWQTDAANTGYGSNKATKLGTTISLAGGAFSFPNTLTCSTGQFIYLTATGGDVTNGSASPMTNNNAVLVAVVGPCSSFTGSTAQSKTFTVINEVSTVAAAYALDGFFTEDASTLGSQKVYFGAPANNNASTGACTGTGTAFACTAAGLTHAFANAANIADTTHFDGTQPSGLALTAIPGNTANSSVPQAVIHSLADILQYCVNSAGGVAGDSSACGTLFTNATAPSGAVPTDTFAAMVNIAQAPYNNVGTSTSTACSVTPPTTATGLFSLIPSTPAFVPVLACPPHDWAVAIAYSGSSTGTFGSPQFATLDANDNVYVQTSNTYTATQLGLAGMSSTGTGIFNVAQSANLCLPGQVAADALGNVYSSVNAATSKTCSYAIYEYSATTGALETEFGPGTGTVCNLTAPTSATCPGFPATGYDTVHSVQSTPAPIAFDHFNNMWYGRDSSSCTSCLFQMPYTAPTVSGTPGTYGTNVSSSTQGGMVSLYQLLIDSNQDVWAGNYASSSGTPGNVYLLTNTGTAAAPAYTTTTGFQTGKLLTYDNGGIGLDSSGNLWTGSNTDVYEFTPTGTGATLTLPSAATFTATTTASHPTVSEVDGAGTYWYPSLTASGSIFLQLTPLAPNYSSTTAANNIRTIRPCYVPAGATTCDVALGTTTYASGDTKSVQVDSAGALWTASGVVSSSATGFVLQILGTAAPTWPLYQLGSFGVKPQ